MLSCKEIIVAEDGLYITMQPVTTPSRIALVLLLVSMCYDAAQVLVYLLVSMCQCVVTQLKP